MTGDILPTANVSERLRARYRQAGRLMWGQAFMPAAALPRGASKRSTPSPGKSPAAASKG